MHSSFGHTQVASSFNKGSDLIEVASAVELFGAHVHYEIVDGTPKIVLKDPNKPLTIQCGRNSSINVHRVVDHELHVTPITVENAEMKGETVFFGSNTAPISKDGRIDFEKLKNEVDLIDKMNLFKNFKTNEIEQSQQEQATAKMLLADACFWEGMQAEVNADLNKLLYCPPFDSTCETEFQSRFQYSEAVRHLTDAIELDLSNPSFYLKRSAALAKLKLFDRALPDASTYAEMRPASPSGHCMRGVCLHGQGELNAAIAALREGLRHGSVAYWDASRVWSTGTDLERALAAAAADLRRAVATAGAANAQGLTWLELREYGPAVARLHEAAALTARALGREHLSYAACVNNLAACLESMGNYDDALRHYTEALQVLGDTPRRGRRP